MRQIASILLAVIYCLPCAMVLHHEADGSLGVFNIIGVAWLAFLILGGWHLITPDWMRKELERYMSE